LAASLQDGEVQFTADSDTVITRGLIALLIRTLSGQKPADIAQSDLHFINQIGLQEHLSPTRSNGLRSMVKQMKLYGLALAAKS
jgi:cysteine desulfuration protein SufE